MIDAVKFRQVLGQYPTGVVVVTAYDATGGVAGMTLGSFTSVSLEPPLVAFLPSTTSSSWRGLQETGSSYGINILGNDQESVCRAVAMKKEGKFDDIETYPSPHGNPVIAGSVAFLDCSVNQITDAGDHQIVVCDVHDLDTMDGNDPLLFFRGGYGSFTSDSLAAWGPGLLDRLKAVDVARPLMDQLASTFDTEVTVSSLVNDDIVILAAAGRSQTQTHLTRIGARYPFVAPVGSLYAAWGDEKVRERWYNSAPWANDAERLELRSTVEQIRERGFHIFLGHESNERFYSSAVELASGSENVTKDELWRLFQSELSIFYPATLPSNERVEFRCANAPVLDAEGRVAFALLLWGPGEPITWAEVMVQVQALVTAASQASDALRTLSATG